MTPPRRAARILPAAAAALLTATPLVAAATSAAAPSAVRPSAAAATFVVHPSAAVATFVVHPSAAVATSARPFAASTFAVHPSAAAHPSAARLVVAPPADPSTPTPAQGDARKAAARKAAEAAATAFAAGDHAAALARFEEAMTLRPNPKLHYNLGVCHQRLLRDAAARGDTDAEARHADTAIAAFNAYLRDVPDAPDRAAVEVLIRDLGGTPITQPQLRDPLAPLPTAPSSAPTPPPGPIPRPHDVPAPAPAPAPPPAPAEPPLPRGYLGAATGLLSEPQLVDTADLDGAYQLLLLARGGARLGKRRGLELGAQVWLAVPGQTSATTLALATQALLVDIGHAVRLGPRRRLELPLGLELGVAREGLRVRAGQPLPACAAGTSGTLVSARPGGVAGGRLGLAVLVGPRRNHEIGMHIHLAFFGFGSGPDSAASTCDERPFAAAGIAKTRLVLSTSLGYAFRF